MYVCSSSNDSKFRSFNKILTSCVRRDSSNEKKSPVPQGLWQSCPNCKEIIYGPDLESNLYVCTNCDHHIRIGARHRLSYLFDESDTMSNFGRNSTFFVYQLLCHFIYFLFCYAFIFALNILFNLLSILLEYTYLLKYVL